MATHNDFGKEAEEFAVKYLENNGYQIIKTNFRYLKAEIDIIAKFANKIVIVEVKARSYNHIAEPENAVNTKKKRLLITAANHFMEEQNREEEVRFDIISVLPNSNGTLEIHHIKNAFESIDY